MTDARLPRASVALISGSALAYEILLMRIFSITEWHHTAYMVISLALLGYGASGTLLSFVGGRWVRDFGAWYPRLLALAGLSMVVSAVGAQRLAVHPEQLLWEPGLIARLSLVYGILAIPFLFVGAAVGLALMRFETGRVYASDLAGAGLGSALVVLLLWQIRPMEGVTLVASVAIAAAVVGALERGGRVRRWSVIAGALIVALWVVPASWTELRMSPYKALEQTMRIPGTAVIEEHSSPLALVSVLESREVPLRHAPDLSLSAPRGPGEQLGVFLDGDSLTPINIVDADEGSLTFLEYGLSALPYTVIEPRSALILGVGGGEGVLRAQRLGVESIVGVELNPQVAELLATSFADPSGRLFEPEGTELHIGDARGYAASSDREFDLVELMAPSSLGGRSSSVSEDYRLTVEALDQFLERVGPSGLLAIGSRIANPPRDTLRLFDTAVQALLRRGVTDPTDRLALVRGWQTSVLLVRNGAFEEDEIARLRRFCERHFFDLAFLPGLQPEEVNRFNRLPEPVYFRATQALVSAEREPFLADYKFAIRAPTDDRPFFHQSFRWQAFSEIWRLRTRGGLPLLEAGYPVLLVTLAQAVGFSLIFVLLPMAAHRTESPRSSRWRALIYFGGLGLGFLFLEVVFLQKYILFLHHPIYAAALVLASFLLFAGLGSRFASKAQERWGPGAARRAIAMLLAVGVVEVFALRLLSEALVGSPLSIRVLLGVAAIAPLAFCMGLPFPLGIERLKQRFPELVPWAWAINGCASVISPVLATLLAVHLGFQAVIWLALAVYGLAVYGLAGLVGPATR